MKKLPSVLTSPIRFSIISSDNPKRLAKEFREHAGQLKKTTHAFVSSGTVEQIALPHLGAFAEVIQSLQPNQAFMFGVNKKSSARIVSSSLLMLHPGAITRQKAHFNWPQGPAILCLDYDPPLNGPTLPRDQLLDALSAACPMMGHCGRLWVPSSSSYLRNTDTGESLTNLKGQRVYIAITDGDDLERAASVLQARLWLHGFGRFEVSKSGQKLERTIIDGAVFQPNHLDFAASPICIPPIAKKAVAPLIYDGPLLDTVNALPNLSDKEKAQLKLVKANARRKVAPEAQARRESFVARQVEKIKQQGQVAGEALADAPRASVELALRAQVLDQHYVITLAGGADVTVKDILENPEKYDNQLTLDPLEPDYDGGRAVGKLFTKGLKPCLFSFAHGRCIYRLKYTAVSIEIPVGNAYRATEQTLAVLRRHPQYFDFGSQMVLVDEGNLHPLTKDDLKHHLGGVIQYREWRINKNGDPYNVKVDPPPTIVNALLALSTQHRKLTPLNGIITAPLVRPDGSVLCEPGYDKSTRLIAHIPEQLADLPEEPTLEEADAALTTLLQPFAQFPFASSLDKSVLLAAIITAFQRPILPTAPAFAFDAPVQGSGKTLLAQCIAALACGKKVPVMPHVDGRFNDEEFRKRLLAILLTGDNAVIFDNIVESFDSAALAAALTSETYRDRILRKSQLVDVPNRSLCLFTGNNLTFKGDVVRRVLVSRIDPSCERPYAREFENDPLRDVIGRRQEMAIACITLIRCARANMAHSEAQIVAGKTASFELWDALVRQTVAWVATTIRPDEYVDPLQAVDKASAQDPERELLEQFHALLFSHFGAQEITAREITNYCGGSSTERSQLWEILCELTGDNNPTSIKVGHALRRLTGRRSKNYVIERLERCTRRNTALYRMNCL